ncbi:hypothetical protein J6590_000145 [Homalodisca vitripennis]|nr:hypothetical protein J6590_000145 [Homalodisca vitripennis]
MFDLQSLSLRRKFLDLVFLNKIVSGVLDCPVILSYIDISIPRGTRSKTIFQRRSMPSYYAYNSSVPRLLRCGSKPLTKRLWALLVHAEWGNIPLRRCHAALSQYPHQCSAFTRLFYPLIWLLPLCG